MANGLTPAYLRHRARYWCQRADQATADHDKQIRLRQAAAILDREADQLEAREAAAKKAAAGL